VDKMLLFAVLMHWLLQQRQTEASFVNLIHASANEDICRCYSKTIEEIQQQNVDTWRFYRITVIFEYEDKPSFPPPLIIISHLRSICLYVYDKTKRSDASGANSDNGKFVFVFYYVLLNIIVKKLNSLKHLVRTTVAESHN